MGVAFGPCCVFACCVLADQEGAVRQLGYGAGAGCAWCGLLAVGRACRIYDFYQSLVMNEDISDASHHIFFSSLKNGTNGFFLSFLLVLLTYCC